MPTWSGSRGGFDQRSTSAEPCSLTPAPTWWSDSAAMSQYRPIWRRGAVAAVPDRCRSWFTRRTLAPVWPIGSVRASPDGCSRRCRDPVLLAPRLSACHCGLRSPAWIGLPCANRRAGTSDSHPMPPCCWCSAVRRGRCRSTGRCRPPRPNSPPPVFRCCTSTARRTPWNCRAHGQVTPPMWRWGTWTGWTSPTPQPTWRSAVPVR